MAQAVEEEKGHANGSDDFTQDGTVDLKGNPVLRSKTGKWRACSFVVGYEVFERMAYYGIATNLVLYLTTKLHEGTVTSSNNVTNWGGTVWLTPILGAYIADAYLGRYWTFVIASAIYLMGMILLTLAVSIPALRPPECRGAKDCNQHATALQEGIFYCALYVVAIGTGGTKPNISTIGADQFDEFEPKERKQKLSFFNWWMFSIFFGTLFSNTFLVYIQDNVGFTLGYALPSVGLAISVIVFLFGTPLYRHKMPTGSPMTTIARVFVAAARKRKLTVPNDPKELYELSLDEYSKLGKFRVDYSPSYRFLDKAAVKTGQTSPWMLSTVTQIEETKRMVKMLPILIATFIPSTLLAQTHTLFVKQGTLLDRKIGNFTIRPANLAAFVTISMLISIVLYDRLFVPFIRKYTKNPRGITLLQRLTIGLLVHMMIMVTASLAERRRLSVAREHGIVGKKQVVPLSIFILLPQFALTGVADCFAEVAKLEFFYDQAPEGMKSLGTSYFTSSLGVGNFLSSFLLTTVADISKKHGNGWILDNLNLSHLDYYYAFFAVLGFINFLIFLVIAKHYVYNVDVKESDLEMRKTIDSIPSNDAKQELEGSNTDEVYRNQK
ncbi:Proton-dependent oligopeptide transporter family [Dillenia turbinata]|uniref:Proton-dependent oligopeptide transporter family n=1 Tax=Dillenia turbinata TaxID=194707 RepID=A0AAN8VP75_9MAGN